MEEVHWGGTAEAPPVAGWVLSTIPAERAAHQSELSAAVIPQLPLTATSG